jgi:hypothetical protein
VIWRLLACLLLLGLGQADAQSLSPPPIGRSATFAGAPGNPTGTTSTTQVMMGLGATCAITPKTTGNVYLVITGQAANNTAADGVNGQLMLGTDAPPANGAASTGVAAGNGFVFAANGTAASGFTGSTVLTNQPLGTAIWFDLRIAAITSGTATVTAINCTGLEIR